MELINELLMIYEFNIKNLLEYLHVTASENFHSFRLKEYSIIDISSWPMFER